MTNMIDNNKQTFLLNDVEVVLTGRTATRTLRNNKIDERVEVKPKNPEKGTWATWVKRSELYEIQ